MAKPEVVMTPKVSISPGSASKDETIKKTGPGRQLVLAAIGWGESYRMFILPLLFAFCTIFYYSGEIVNLLGLDALRWSFFYSVHDTHRLLFLVPIVYAGYVARVRGAIIITLVSFVVFLPRAFLISPYPDPVLRMALFTAAAGIIGILTGIASNEYERRRRLETLLKYERDKTTGTRV